MQTNRKGLTSAEARARLDQEGKNELTQQAAPTAAGIFFSQFKDLMSMILAAATLLSAMLGEFTDAVTILAIVVLNAIMGFVQEYRTEKTMEALAQLSAPVARAWRDGSLTRIPANEVVRGDVVSLTAGDRIPADGRAIDPAGISADESLLTGESLPVAKKPGDMLYMGTNLSAGRCEMEVTATGMKTEMGKIAGMLGESEEKRTPLQVRLDDLGKVIAVGCILICAAVSLIGWLRGEDPMTMLLTGISLSVAAIPEGLPAIVTIVLALSVGRILRKGAIIRKLHAVETLGCAGVICTDKTGTITQNRMSVRRVWSAGTRYEMTGTGLSTKGGLTKDGRSVDAAKDQVLSRMLTAAVLCNGATLEKKGTHYQVQGEPTETALLVMAAKAGYIKEKMRSRQLSERPFDSARKLMSVTVRLPEGDILLCKGAPDVLLRRCNRIATKEGSRPMSAADRQAAGRAAAEMAQDALRVLGFAEGAPGGGEEDLIFLGLAGMLDPPRPEVAPAVANCKKAGIRPVMITGDHRDTAAAIAKEVGIYKDGDMVVTGEELDRMSDAELTAASSKISVFARVSPAHKLRIVRAFQTAGQIVAMTGDGVNDAPAVKQADIGVAMGGSGTDVTKEASSVVILDDNFATIVSAVEEGRVIYRNIRSFIRYLLTCNLGEVTSMLFSLLLGAPVALMPIQILMVNLLTDGLPAVALGMEPPVRSVMERPPRPKDEGLFAHGLMATIIVRGIFLGLCTSGVFNYVLNQSADLDLARSACYLVLVLSQMVHLFECRGKGIWVLDNPCLLGASAFSVLLTFLSVYLPPLQAIFGTTAVGLEWALPVAIGIFAGPVLFWLLRVVTRPFRYKKR